MTDRTGNVIGILFVVCVVIALAAITPYVDSYIYPKPSKTNIDLSQFNLKPTAPVVAPAQPPAPAVQYTPAQPNRAPVIRNSANDAFVRQQMDEIERSKEHIWQMSVGQDTSTLQNNARQKENDYYHEKNKPNPDPYWVNKTRHDSANANAAADESRRRPHR